MSNVLILISATSGAVLLTLTICISFFNHRTLTIVKCPLRRQILCQTPSKIHFLRNSFDHSWDLFTSCAVYSAAKAHPTVTILVHTNGIKQPHSTWKALSNIRIVNFNSTKIFTDAHLEHWLNAVQPLTDSVRFISDMERVLVLKKYGGAALDSDVITINGYCGIENSLVIQEPGTLIGNSIQFFDVGHPFLDTEARRLKEHHSGRYADGPGMLTKAWRTYQGTMEALTHPVNLQQPKYFFAIPFSQSKLLYDINLNAAQVYEDRIARARSVHFWNYVVDQNALMKSPKQE